MKRKMMASGKGFLLSGILILSVLFLGQLGWACDTPDYNEYECYGELDIKRVSLDYDNGLIQIFGKDFKNGAFPVVTLGDDGLDVLDHDYNKIVVRFPAMEAGQYKLHISTGESRNCKDKYSLNIPHDHKPSCPQPPTPCPEPCPPGCKGEKGDKGDKGDQGIQGIQGEKGDKGDPGVSVKSAEAFSLLDSKEPARASFNADTGLLSIWVPKGADGADGINGTNGTNGTNGIDGLPGPAGPSGILGGWKIVEFVVTNLNADDLFDGEAPCDTDNGYALTGGGFQAPRGVTAIVSKPLKATYTESGKTYEIGIGWKVVGEITGDFAGGSVTVYAVCACVDPEGCN